MAEVKSKEKVTDEKSKDALARVNMEQGDVSDSFSAFLVAKSGVTEARNGLDSLNYKKEIV